MKVNSNCRYRTHGNLCKFEHTCSAKDYFDKPVDFQDMKIYGVCDEAEVF